MHSLNRIFRGLTLISIAAGLMYFALPGQHRALTPQLFGLTQVQPNLFIDDVSRSAQALDLIAQADRTNRAFFGPLEATPTFLFCYSVECADDFGIHTSGLTLRDRFILLSPQGINPMIVTHERAHAELHGFGSWVDYFDPIYPMWFDEGLASFISADSRLMIPQTVGEAIWTTDLHTWRDWGAVVTRENWPQVYGASLGLVTDIIDQSGCSGLYKLIQDVRNGADFDVALDELPGTALDRMDRKLHVKPCLFTRS
ncbi:hypothetical protein [Aestuariibius sp. HNIBRBA575]|uniref:hypothetical protein n=1 Tax=Aestuariibius sp. HNIBRBA575 TaxID=3233343 RepID=UPI0034A1E07C